MVAFCYRHSRRDSPLEAQVDDCSGLVQRVLMAARENGLVTMAERSRHMRRRAGPVWSQLLFPLLTAEDAVGPTASCCRQWETES